MWVCERDGELERPTTRGCVCKGLMVVIFIHLLKTLSLKAVVQNHHLTLSHDCIFGLPVVGSYKV